MPLCLYHSFPRRSLENGVDVSDKRGLNILESIFHSGLLLVPEVIEYQGEIDDKTWSIGEPLLSFQRRICFSHLSSGRDLFEHSELFGEFGVAFNLDDLRSSGAIPVFYIPQPTNNMEAGYGLLGNTLIHRLAEVQSLLHKLDEINNILERNQEVDEIEMESDGRETKYIKSDQLYWFLSKIIAGKQSYKDLESTIKILSNFFYPTEKNGYNSLENERKSYKSKIPDLSYYRQREWRIVGGVNVVGEETERELTQMEKDFLLYVDFDFYSRKLITPIGEIKLLDECRILKEINGEMVRERIVNIVVPKIMKNNVEKILLKYGVHCEITQI